MSCRTLSLLLGLIALCLSASAEAGDPRTHPGIPVAQPPTIDGKVSEGEWPEGSRLDGFYDPLTGAAGPENTIAYLVYDAKAIYVAFRCEDSKAAEMQAREVNYGASFGNDDHVTFKVGPYGQKTDAGLNDFRVNMINTQQDDISGGRAAKREWRGFWTSATSRDDQGWTCEMRIPWEILNYEPGSAKNLDINLERYSPRTRIETQWSNLGIQQRAEFLGTWSNVDLPTVKRGNTPQFLGYLAPGYDRGDVRVRAGLDVRYGLTPQSTALLSINPDFENIEGQVAGVEFTRTERFLDDTRPFFNEGEDFFNLTGEFNFGTMFYSNRVGQFDYGMKAFGQLDRVAKLGVLSTVQAGGLNATVANLAFIPGPNASSNFYATHSAERGRHNSAFGGNFYTRKGNWGWEGSLAGESQKGDATDGAGSAAISYSVPNIFSITRASWTDKGFDPALGYVAWQGRRGGYHYTEYNREFRTGPLLRYGADIFLPQYQTDTGRVQQRGYEVSARIVTRSDIRFAVWRERMQWFNDHDMVDGARVVFNDSNRFKRFGISYDSGRRGGQGATFTNAFGSYRLGKIDFGFSQSLFIRGSSDRLTIGTVGWEISPTRSVSARVVQRDDKTNAYLSFRNAGGRGMEYFVIVGDPNADEWRDRLAIKLVWAF